MIEMFLRMTTPVIINCYGDISFLKQTVEQLHASGFKNIIVIANNISNHINDQFIIESEKSRLFSVVRSNSHIDITNLCDSELYQSLPPLFIYSTPDFTWPDGIANDLICRYISLSEKYKIAQIGSALCLPDEEMTARLSPKMPGIINETMHWQHEVEPGVYKAPADTTWHLVNKAYFSNIRIKSGMRVSGKGYECTYLPWTSGKQDLPTVHVAPPPIVVTDHRVTPTSHPLQNALTIKIINAGHRQDRKLECRTELSTIGIDGHDDIFFTAKFLKDFGARGCALSHAMAISQFLFEGDKPYLMLLEDDFHVRDKTTFFERVNVILQLTAAWDVYLLGHNHAIPIEPLTPWGSNRVINSQTTSGYIVGRLYAAKLIESFFRSSELLNRTVPMPPNIQKYAKHFYCCDILWKELQIHDRFLADLPALIQQRPSFSDIERRQVDYKV